MLDFCKILTQRNISIFIIGLLIVVGSYLRFSVLSTHFTHYDSVFMATDVLKAKSPQFKTYLLQRAYDSSRPAYDQLYMRAIRQTNDNKYLRPLLEIAIKISPVFIVPATSTNPPLQYLVIAPLINEHQTYQQILFWGRFSSAVFSILCFGLLLLILKKIYKNDYLPISIFSLTLLVFSWQHIIYAKQIYTYSIGVFCALAMIWLFLKILTDPNSKWLSYSGAITALFVYSTYQMIFLVPAFYAVLLLIFYMQKNKKKIVLLFKNMAIYFVLILPALWYVLVRFPGSGITRYNAGPHQEYAFSLAGHSSILGKLFYFIKFYILNFYQVLQTNLAFMPLNKTIGLAFFILFIWGGYKALADKQNKLKNYTAWLMLAVLFTWFGLVFIKKITLSPTRITLIYLPIMLLLVSDGLISLLRAVFRSQEKKILTAIICLSALIAVSFFYYYPGIIKQRIDPVKESEFKQLVKKYKIDTIIAYDYSLNVNLMNSVKPYVNYYEEDIPVHSSYQKGWPFRTIMFFSTRTKFSPAVFETMRREINNDQELKNMFKYRFNDYKIVYHKVLTSATEIEFNNKNKNGSNNLYLVVLERKK